MDCAVLIGPVKHLTLGGSSTMVLYTPTALSVISTKLNDLSVAFRTDCLLSTWQRKGITSNASSIFCSTRRLLMMSHWTTSPRSMWRHTVVITKSPNCCWTRGPTPTPGLWYDKEIPRNHFLVEIGRNTKQKKIKFSIYNIMSLHFETKTYLHIAFVHYVLKCVPCSLYRMASLHCT